MELGDMVVAKDQTGLCVVPHLAIYSLRGRRSVLDPSSVFSQVSISALETNPGSLIAPVKIIVLSPGWSPVRERWG
jgi:hypothetical protein